MARVDVEMASVEGHGDVSGLMQAAEAVVTDLFGRETSCIRVVSSRHHAVSLRVLDGRTGSSFLVKVVSDGGISRRMLSMREAFSSCGMTLWGAAPPVVVPVDLSARSVSEHTACAVVSSWDDGMALSEHLLDGPSESFASRALDVLTSMLDVLASASEGTGVSHGDIRLGNIMCHRIEGAVDDRTTAVLVDYDTAYVKGEPAVAVPLGTYAYMAPERFDAGACLTSAADVYSAGVLVHRLLAGSLPSGSPVAGRMDRGVWERFHRRSAGVRSATCLPHVVRQVLDGCLDVDAGSRPSPRELQHALSIDAFRGAHGKMEAA